MPSACSAVHPVTEANVLDVLTKYGADNARFVAHNPKLLKATFDLLKAMQSGDPLAGTAALASATSSGSKAIHAAPGLQKTAKATSFAISTFKATMDLSKVARLTSTGAVVAYVGSATVHKTGLLVSMAGGDSERAKCIGAVMEVAGSMGTTMLVAPTGILAVLSAISLAASTHNAYLACTGQ